MRRGPGIEGVDAVVLGLEGRQEEVDRLDEQVMRGAGESHEGGKNQFTVQGRDLDICVLPYELARLRLKGGDIRERGPQPGGGLTRGVGTAGARRVGAA